MVKIWRTKKQINKINPKMGFWRAKQGLSKHGLKRPKLVSNLGESLKTYGRRRREEEEEEEEEKKRKRRSSKKVWELTLIMNSMRFGMDLWFCMIIILTKPRVLLRFHLIPKIMESKVGKTLNSARRS